MPYHHTYTADDLKTLQHLADKVAELGGWYGQPIVVTAYNADRLPIAYVEYDPESTNVMITFVPPDWFVVTLTDDEEAV